MTTAAGRGPAQGSWPAAANKDDLMRGLEEAAKAR
jgi:hypothetical protein